MRTLAINIAKGGVGKTMLSCQLSRYAHFLGLRVLVMDLDDQANATKSLERDQAAERLSTTSTKVFLAPELKAILPECSFALVASDGRCGVEVVEHSRVKDKVDGEEHERYLIANRNLREFLDTVSEHFDLCVMDCPPGSDVRISMVLAAADACISPIQLAQESFEGMAETLNGFRGVLRIKSTMNPELKFIGFLPNMVERTAKQQEALQSLGQKMGQYFMLDETNSPLGIPKRESLANAQGRGIFIGDLAKTNTAARETWTKVRKVFDEILNQSGLTEDIQAAQDRKREAKLVDTASLKVEEADEAVL